MWNVFQASKIDYFAYHRYFKPITYLHPSGFARPHTDKDVERQDGVAIGPRGRQHTNLKTNSCSAYQLRSLAYNVNVGMDD